VSWKGWLKLKCLGQVPDCPLIGAVLMYYVRGSFVRHFVSKGYLENTYLQPS
jgi:hypothetical protein